MSQHVPFRPLGMPVIIPHLPPVIITGILTSLSGRERLSPSHGSNGGGSGMWDTFSRRQEGAILGLLEHLPSACPVLAVATHLFGLFPGSP